MIKKIKKIIIFGGGTSGWLTAAYLVNNLQIPTEIHLIEDSSIGPIGVGEGTQPLTARFLYEAGIEPKAWLKDSKAVFKYGVECIGWNDEPYFVDNDVPQNSMIAGDLYAGDYFIGKPYKDLASWHPSYQLAKNNISSKLDGYLDANYGSGPDSYGAVHFSAYDIIATIKKIILPRIKFTDVKIDKVLKDQTGITELVDEYGKSYTADLYIDCTGFKSELIEKQLGSPFISYKDYLLCDSAVAFATEYTDPVKECHPFTKATTMSSGWRWTIPIFDRIGNGYVYSSKFLTPEQAEKELRDATGEYSTPARHVKIKSGTRKEVARQNVVAVGLSAGFIEPLEATGITFTTNAVITITQLLNRNGNLWNDFSRNTINHIFYEMSIEILAFVWSHYHFSNRSDTDFWKEIRKSKISDLPLEAQKIIEQFYPNPPRFMFLNPTSMFSSFQWFTMMHAGGAYNQIKNKLTTSEIKYCEYFLKGHTARVELAKEMFPNQYEYLKSWYQN